jgi:hypothetical protein
METERRGEGHRRRGKVSAKVVEATQKRREEFVEGESTERFKNFLSPYQYTNTNLQRFLRLKTVVHESLQRFLNIKPL